MAQLLVLGIMLTCAILPFVALTLAMRKGYTGLALTGLSVVGACLAILWFASGRPIGIDPVTATWVALLGFVPAFLGSSAGAFLGWLLRREDDRRAGN